MQSPTLTYAIGDVHGRADLLARLLDGIAQDADRHNARYKVLFLGDIIDRGLQSRQAMDLVCSTLDAVPGSRLILGNHDEFLRRVLDLGDDCGPLLRAWAARYGAPTLASYGLLDCEEAKMVPRLMRDRFSRHVDALTQAACIIVEGDYAFVHAGVSPGVSFDRQTEKDLRCIRDDFLTCEEPFEKIVIHGHTETTSGLPEVFPNRIAVDTGAFRTGLLTAAVISREVAVRFLSASEDGGVQEITPHLSTYKVALS